MRTSLATVQVLLDGSWRVRCDVCVPADACMHASLISYSQRRTHLHIASTTVQVHLLSGPRKRDGLAVAACVDGRCAVPQPGLRVHHSASSTVTHMSHLRHPLSRCSFLLVLPSPTAPGAPALVLRHAVALRVAQRRGRAAHRRRVSAHLSLIHI